MRRDVFRQILDSRLSVMRKYVIDPTLTKKQRAALKKAILRRERVGNSLRTNKYLVPRTNTSIYTARSPTVLRSVASRYRNSMSNSQRENLVDQLRNVRRRSEEQSMRAFARSGNYKQFLKEMRDLKRHTLKTLTHVGSRNPK